MRKRSHHGGLLEDLRTMRVEELRRNRRQMLWMMAGASVLPLVGCASTSAVAVGDDADGGSGTGLSSSSGGDCSVIPQETGGPYPGDGSNGVNVLDLDGIVRSDIRSSFGSYSGTAEGIPLTVNLTVVNAADSCLALPGAAVYLWHCDRDGHYSLYTVTDQNYLRGVQEADDNGLLSFTTVFPGCYSGRWPHIHFEVFTSLDSVMTGAQVRTSQLALPEDVCSEVYATSGYESSVSNLSRISLSSDNVFSDGVDTQMAEVTGSTADGYVANLTVGVSL